MIRVVRVQCRSCGRICRFSSSSALPDAFEQRLKCTRCGKKRVEVSITWHDWPTEKWLRDLPRFPEARPKVRRLH